MSDQLLNYSLISISLIAENSNSNYLLARSELIEESFELIRSNDSDILKLKECLFIINKSYDKSSIILKEAEKNEVIKYNDSFILTHFLSNKYLSIRRNNYFGSYELYLTSSKLKASYFSFSRIFNIGNNKEMSIEFLSKEIQYNEIIHIQTFIKEKNKFYSFHASNQAFPYVFHLPTKIGVIDTDKLNNEILISDIPPISFSENEKSKIVLINQSHYLERTYLNQSSIFNLQFSVKNKVFLLGIDIKNRNKIKTFNKNQFNLKKTMFLNEYSNKNELSKIESNAFNYHFQKSSVANIIKQSMKVLFQNKDDLFETEYIVKLIPLSEEFKNFSNDFLNYSIWNFDSVNKSNLLSGSKVRIKNILLDMYLGIEEIDINQIKNYDESEIYIEKNKYYKFVLSSFKNKSDILSNFNFVINNYNQTLYFNDKSRLIINKSLNMSNEMLVIPNSKNKFSKPMNEFIYNIKTIDLKIFNQSYQIHIYINQLNYLILNYKKNKYIKNYVLIKTLQDYIMFFIRILINKEESHYSENYSKNISIEKIQMLLYEYKIIPLLKNMINLIYELNSESSYKNSSQDIEIIQKCILKLLSLIIYFTENNSFLKKKIFYDNIIMKIIIIYSIVYQTNTTNLLFFLLKIIKHSEIYKYIVEVSKKIVIKMNNLNIDLSISFNEDDFNNLDFNYINLIFLFKLLSKTNKFFYFINDLYKLECFSNSINIFRSNMLILTNIIYLKHFQSTFDIDFKNDDEEKFISTYIVNFNLIKIIDFEYQIFPKLFVNNSTNNKKDSKTNISYKLLNIKNNFQFFFLDNIPSEILLDILNMPNLPELISILPFKIYSYIFPTEKDENNPTRNSSKDLIMSSNDQISNELSSKDSEILDVNLITMTHESIVKKTDANEFNNIFFYFQFCSYKFFEGLYEILLIMKEYCINYLTENEFEMLINNYESIRCELFRCYLLSFNSIKGKTKQIIKNLIEKIFLTSVNEQINIVDLLTLKENEILYGLNFIFNEDEYFNINYIYKLSEIIDKIHSIFFIILNLIKYKRTKKKIILDERLNNQKFLYIKYMNDISKVSFEYNPSCFYNLYSKLNIKLTKYLTNSIIFYSKDILSNIIYINNSEILNLYYKCFTLSMIIRNKNQNIIDGFFIDNSLNFKYSERKDKYETSSFTIDVDEIIDKSNDLFSLLKHIIEYESEIDTHHINRSYNILSLIDFKNIYFQYFQITKLHKRLKRKKISINIIILLIKSYKILKSERNWKDLLNNNIEVLLICLDYIILYFKNKKGYLIKSKSNSTKGEIHEIINDDNLIVLNDSELSVDSLVIEKSNKKYLKIMFECCKEFIILSQRTDLLIKSSFKNYVKGVIIKIQSLYNLIKSSFKTEFFVYYLKISSCILKDLLSKKKDIVLYESLKSILLNKTFIRRSLKECMNRTNKEYSNKYKKLSKNIKNIKKYQNLYQFIKEYNFDFRLDSNSFLINIYIIYCLFLNEKNIQNIKNNKNDIIHINEKTDPNRTFLNETNLFETIKSYLDTYKINARLKQEAYIENMNEFNDINDFIKYQIMINSLRSRYVSFQKKTIKSIMSSTRLKFKNLLGSYIYNDFTFEYSILQTIIKNTKTIKYDEKKQNINNNQYYLYYSSDVSDILMFENLFQLIHEKMIFTKRKNKKLEKEIIKKKHVFLEAFNNIKLEKVLLELIYDKYIQYELLPFINSLKLISINNENYSIFSRYYNFKRFIELYDNQLDIIKKNNSFIFDSVTNNFIINIMIEDSVIVSSIKYNHLFNINLPIDNYFLTILDYLKSNLIRNYNKDSFSYINFISIMNIIQEFSNILIIPILNSEIYRNEKLFKEIIDILSAIYKYLSYSYSFFIREKKYILTINDFLIQCDFLFRIIFNKLINQYDFFKSLDSYIILKEINYQLQLFKSLTNFLKNYSAFICLKLLPSYNNQHNNINIIENMIKILYVLLNIQTEESLFNVKNIISFFDKYVNDLNMDSYVVLFDKDYFSLLRYCFNINYFEIILNNLKNPSLKEKVSLYIEIEYKVINIFLTYIVLIINKYSEYKNKYQFDVKEIDEKLYNEKKNIEYIRKELIGFIKENYNLISRKLKLVTTFLNFELKGKLDKTETCLFNHNFNNSENFISDYIFKFEIILSYYSLFQYSENIMQFEKRIKILKKSNLLIFYDKIIYILKIIWGLCLVIPKSILYILHNNKKKINSNKEIYKKLFEIEEMNESDLFDIKLLSNYIYSCEFEIENIIFKIYFPLLSHTKLLYDNKFQYGIFNKDTNNSYDHNQIYMYFSFFNKIKDILVYNNRIENNFQFPFFKFLIKNMKSIKIMWLFLIFLINFIMSISFYESSSNCHNMTTYNRRMNCPSILFNEDVNIQDKTDQLILIVEYLLILFFILDSIIIFIYSLRNKNYENSHLKINRLLKLIRFIFKILFTKKVLYILLKTIIIVLGKLIHPFFYSLLILNIFFEIKESKFSLIVLNKSKLLFLNIIIAILMFHYYFTLFLFNNYHEKKSYINNKETYSLTGSLLSNIKDSLLKNYHKNEFYDKINTSEFNIIIFIIDNFYYLFNYIVFSNLFIAIMKDAFTFLRKNKYNSSSYNNCIICELNEEEIDRLYNKQRAFETHIYEDHNIWNYFSYFIYLTSKNKNLSEIEKYILRRFNEKNYVFFPKKNTFIHKISQFVN